MCKTARAPYEVGHYYRVPCVRGRLYDAIGWWPVMGEAHRDVEIIGFAPLHYHVDWRFVSEARYNRYVRRIGFGLGRGESIEAHAAPLMLMPEPGRNVRRIENALGDLERATKRLKCKRALPPYPYADARWIPALSASMAAELDARFALMAGEFGRLFDVLASALRFSETDA